MIRGIYGKGEKIFPPFSVAKENSAEQIPIGALWIGCVVDEGVQLVQMGHAEL